MGLWPFRSRNNVGAAIAQKLIEASDLTTAKGMAASDLELGVPGADNFEYQVPDSRLAGLNGYATEETLVGGLKLTNTTKTPLRVGINTAVTGSDQTLIPTPGAGIKLKIHKLFIQNIGASNVTILLKDSAGTINGAGNLLTPGATLVRENMIGFGDLVLAANSAFLINLSAGVQVSGWVEYYQEA